MPHWLTQWRRGATQFVIRLAIRSTRPLPSKVQHSAARSLGAIAARVPMLRQRVRENMRLALGQDVPAQAERLYFQHVGWFLSQALYTFHHGFAATPLPQAIKFDDSIRILDEAAAEGRGVIITSPHWVGHELAAAAINLRHPMVLLVRDAPTSERAARKLRWYRALGVETVLRSSGSSKMGDALAYLQALRQGKVLAITPDLLTDGEQGAEVSIFGRSARLHGGAFLLAILARAPMIRTSGHWQDETLTLTFERAPTPTGDRTVAVRVALQDWCRWFENKVKANPEIWLFWLDRRWSRLLRAPRGNTE
jgi:lauroyl/myristoyl acyltransferase